MEDNLANKKQVSFRSSAASNLVLSAYSWYGFIVLQALCLLLPQDNGFNNFMHIGGIVLAAVGTFLMFNFGSLLSLSKKEDPSTYRFLSNQFLIISFGCLAIIGLAAAIGVSKVMAYPNVFRNLIIMIGSFNGVWVLWLFTIGAIALMGIILRFQGKKAEQSNSD